MQVGGAGPRLAGTAFLFPGQGSQQAGMGRPWVGHPAWELVATASELTGRDLSRLLLDADPDELRRTANSQMAAFLVGLMAFEALGSVVPEFALGHSLGEYTALVASGVLSFSDGVQLVDARGRAMEDGVERSPGGMSALIGLDAATLEPILRRIQAPVWLANDNAPDQVVVAGTSAGLSALAAAARRAGARRVIDLDVAGAFHTPLMSPARPALDDALASVRFGPARVTLVANVDARPHPHAAQWPGLLGAQLCSSVQWRASLEWAARHGTHHFVELGTAGLLSALAKRTAPAIARSQVTSPAGAEEVAAILLEEAARGDAADLTDGPVGEFLSIEERLVTSPCNGRFAVCPTSDWVTCEGEIVETGAVIAYVGEEPVHAPVRGWLMGLLAIAGQRITTGQAVAWLRPV